MSEQSHIIKRQLIELTVRDAAQAGRLHDEVSRIYRQRIVPLIDRYCSELSAPDRLHRIERLELDIGTLDERRLEADLVAKVGAALRSALAAQIGEQEHGGSPDQSPAALARLELFALFARTGSLPWWADAADLGLLESALRHLLEHAPEPLRRLMRGLAREPGPLRRIVDHLPDDALAMLAASLAPTLAGARAGDLQAVIALLQATQAGAGHRPAALRRSTWAAILHVAGLAGRQHTAAAPFYQAVLRRVAAELGTTYAALRAALRRAARSRDAGALADVLEALEREPAESPDGAAPARRLARVEALRQAPAPPSAAMDRPLGISYSDADELYIGNAGLVILWPFLGSFFARLGLLEGQRFNDIAAQQRAARLLQHIATGDVAFPEYHLPLNKVLCGLELAEVFDFGEPLPDEEAAAGAELLDTAIAEAPILRTMSPDGFRGTFLLRQGVLSARDGAWLLRVERRTYDVVLERFPWGWELVRLPWMGAPLRVEW